ncbi:hypothetical protein ACS0TY_022723 [Phlomoides rotata]
MKTHELLPGFRRTQPRKTSEARRRFCFSGSLQSAFSCLSSVSITQILTRTLFKVNSNPQFTRFEIYRKGFSLILSKSLR